MFYSGVCFGTNNLEEAGKFYDVVFKSINVVRCQTTENEIGYGSSIEEECFWVIKDIPALKNSKSWRKKMSNNTINLIGWILFIISAVGFVISSIGSFWAMFGSIFFFIACFVFLIPFFRKKKD